MWTAENRARYNRDNLRVESARGSLSGSAAPIEEGIQFSAVAVKVKEELEVDSELFYRVDYWVLGLGNYKNESWEDLLYLVCPTCD